MPGKKRPPRQTQPLPLSRGEVWEVGRRELDISVPDLTRRGEQPEVVLVVQTGGEGGVVLGDVVTSSAPLTALADIVLRAMREPLIGKPRRPEVLRVSSAGEAELLAASPGITGVVLEVTGHLTALESLQAHMELQLGGLQSDYRTQAARAGERLSVEGLRAFYRVARQFYREAMWGDYGDEALFEIVCQPEQGVSKTLYGIIIGQLGEEFGLALYPSLEALQQFYESSLEHLEQFADAPPRAKTRHDTAQARREAEAMAELLQVSTLCLTYTRQHDVPPPLVEEVKQFRLPLASRAAFPLVMRTGEGGMRAATAVELADMYVALGAILDWDARIDDAIEDDDTDVQCTSQVRAVPGLVGAMTVQITLRTNPCLPKDDEEGDALLPDLASLFESLLSDAPEEPVPTRKPAARKHTPAPAVPAVPAGPDANLVYTLDVYLTDGPIRTAYANRVVSRRIEILGQQTLHELHQIIFQAFNRWEEHLYEFNLGEGPADRSALYGSTNGIVREVEENAGDPTTTPLATLQLEAGSRFGYTFDLGDQWEHLIEVVTTGTARAKKQYPRITKKVGKAPSQYPDDRDDA